MLDPQKRYTFELPKGQYLITATVMAAGVRNYAGRDVLDGGAYENEFYIRTTAGISR